MFTSRRYCRQLHILICLSYFWTEDYFLFLDKEQLDTGKGKYASGTLLIFYLLLTSLGWLENISHRNPELR
jgi:hypothetical protein